MSQSSTSNRGLNILSIDGGGVRGLSALVLLEEIMRRIQHLEGLDSPPRPHQYFDLIAGTGTGAVQACMLARLRMPVDLTIESYANLAKEVFSERKWFGSGTFKATKLKDSLTRITRNATGNPDEPLMESRPTGTYCKTLVFAMSGHNMRAGIPIAFRSYPAASSQGPECTIWETLCATMAHPELFKSFEIGGPLLKQSFIDAGLGCNNPLSHILAEVKTLYPERQVASVISIGTGHTRTIRIPDRSTMRQLLPTATIQAMKSISEDAEKVAEDMARRFRSTSGVYFRLSVDQGMQSVEMDRWDQLSEVAEHTRAYMRTLDVKQSIDKAAEAIHLRTQSVPTVQLDGEIRLSTTTVTASYVSRSCPAPTPMFTGCDLRLRMAESGITGSENERKVCILHGLGGAGKTQTALKVVERTRSSWNEVVYADASTRESIETALRDVAIAKDIGDTYQSTLQWLESHCEPWLLVLDNADDPSLPIRDYMPGGDHGSVIITTRLSGMVSLARGTDSNCSISSMDPDDALMLLLKCAQRQDQQLSCEELADAKELLQDLGHFALAVSHAGSFIGQSPHMSITEYRLLFVDQQQEALEAYSKLPTAVKNDGYGHTVYTAWLMCYNTLSTRARELLWLVGFLHHTSITVDIFRRAVTSITSHEPKLPTTQLEDSARRKLEDFLSTFLNIKKGWNGLAFTEVINEIVSRSLLDYDYINQAYRAHPLVQSWVRTTVPYEALLALECARSLLAVSATSCVDESLESILFLKSIGTHVERVFPKQLESIGADHVLEFCKVYDKKGQWKKVEQLRTYAHGIQKQVLGSEHLDTLTSLHELARSYSSLGRFEDARALYAQVVDTKKRVLGDDHPETLASLHELARSYWSLGRFEDARDLYTQVVDAKKRVLGDDHPDTLASLHNLASTYLDLGLIHEAQGLQIRVTDFIRVFGENHPWTTCTRTLVKRVQDYQEGSVNSSSNVL